MLWLNRALPLLPVTAANKLRGKSQVVKEKGIKSSPSRWEKLNQPGFQQPSLIAGSIYLSRDGDTRFYATAYVSEGL